jgi:hypothetical protein
MVYSLFLLSHMKTADHSEVWDVPVNLDRNKQYEMALVSFNAYNSIPNINDSNNRFTYSIDDGKTWITLLLPTGCYEISDINNELQVLLTANNHVGYCDIESLKHLSISCIHIYQPSFQIKFERNNNIRSVLGFNESIISGVGEHKSDHEVIIESFNDLVIHCDLVYGSLMNGKQSAVLYSIPPSPPGYRMFIYPNPLIYVPVTKYDIRGMTIKIVDENGDIINFRKERINLRYHLREVQ